MNIYPQYLQTDDFVSRLSLAVIRVVPVLLDLLSAAGLPLSHRVNCLEVGGVRQHSDMKWLSSTHIKLHRGGQVGQHIPDGG